MPSELLLFQAFLRLVLGGGRDEWCLIKTPLKSERDRERKKRAQKTGWGTQIKQAGDGEEMS